MARGLALASKLSNLGYVLTAFGTWAYIYNQPGEHAAPIGWYATTQCEGVGAPEWQGEYTGVWPWTAACGRIRSASNLESQIGTGFFAKGTPLPAWVDGFTVYGKLPYPLPPFYRYGQTGTYTRFTPDEGVVSPWPGAIVAPVPVPLPYPVHPLLNPIGVPRAMPGRAPRPSPARGPLDLPGQAREAGNASPREPVAELHPQVVVTPRGATVTGEPRGPARKPPPRREKEKKTAGEKAVAKVATAAFALTEFQDLVDALVDAIPGPRPKMRAPARLDYLLDNFDRMDASQALENVVENFVQDFFIGKGTAAAQKKLKELGATSTTMNTGERSPLGELSEAMAEIGLI